MSCYLTGHVTGTYHGLTTAFGADEPAQVVVTVQLRQLRLGAPYVTGVLYCGAGEEGEKRAAQARRYLARGAMASLAGQSVTYCARTNTLNVRDLAAVNVITDMSSCTTLRFESLRPQTPEPTTAP
jgi:hypothetical protein